MLYFLINNSMQKFLFLFLFFIISSVKSYSFDINEYSMTSVYKKIRPAIVSIDAQSFFGTSCGTGCIIDKSGIILTSAHVVGENFPVQVTMSNGQNYTATVVKKFGEKKDIVLLKIDTHRKLKTVKFGNSEKVKVGQKVLAIGNPFGFDGTLTQGIVSRIDYTRDRIQTDAAINPGSSGGPLLDKNGKIIGINQAIYNPDNNISNIGIGFAIPINTIKEYIKSD